jgi:hypothetical protein
MVASHLIANAITELWVNRRNFFGNNKKRATKTKLTKQ